MCDQEAETLLLLEDFADLEALEADYGDGGIGGGLLDDGEEGVVEEDVAFGVGGGALVTSCGLLLSRCQHQPAPAGLGIILPEVIMKPLIIVPVQCIMPLNPLRKLLQI